MSRRLFALAVLAFVALPLIVACGGDKGKSASGTGSEKLIPADASLLVSIQVQKLLTDKDVRDAFAKLAPSAGANISNLDDALAEAEKTIGVNPKDITEVLIFANEDVFNQTPSSANLPGAVIVRGNYDKAKVMAALQQQEKTPLKTDTYKGQEIVTNDKGDSAVAFLEKDLFVFGSPTGVESIVDVRKGDKKALSGNLKDSFEALGSPLVKLVVKVPPGALEKALNSQGAGGALGGMSFDLSAFTKITSLGLSLDKKGQDFALQVGLDFPDSASAKKAGDGLNGLMTFIKLLASGSGSNAALSKLNINSQGSRVSIATQFSAKDLQDLGNTFQGLQGIQ